MSIDARKLSIGYLPLNDAALLVAAQELGFYEAEGLSVRLSREASWANIRDKLSVGLLQGAQMLAPMPLAISQGLSGLAVPLITGFSLGLNGNAISISHALREQLREITPGMSESPAEAAGALKALSDRRRGEGLAPLTFAMVFNFSCHNYLLRYWLASAGIDPDQDINLVVIPPPQMAANLAAGRVDGLCVGEPWNQVAAAQGHGSLLLPASRIWPNAPEKVLALREDWAEANPDTHLSMLRALLRASAWLAQAGLEEAAALLAQPQYLNLPADIISQGFGDGGHVFHEGRANLPRRAHALWLLDQMVRWHHLNASVDLQAVARRVYRPDLYREAYSSLFLPMR